MDEAAIYETRRHASRPYTPNYPPQQPDGGGSGGFLLLLSLQGVNRLKGKWLESKQPRKLRKLASLFVSPSGEYVAVAAGNQITILQKKDDYANPCGTFSTGSLVTFTTGIWSESHAVLGVVDDTDTLYFVKANGEEITRIAKRQLKIVSPIVKLVVNNASDVQRSLLCSFIIVTYDGSLQQIEISREPKASINDGLLSKCKFLPNVCGVDYHSELSLLVVVSSSEPGSCNISLWRGSNVMDLEKLFTFPFEGLFTKPKGHNGPLAYPKVEISPTAEFVCAMDVMGQLHILKLNKIGFSLSRYTGSEKCSSQVSDIVDFSWWSDQVIAIVQRNGLFTMIDVLSASKVQETDPIYSMPVLERVYRFQGILFLLESVSSEWRDNFSTNKVTTDSHNIDQTSEDKLNNRDVSKLSWNLMTFTKRTVLEMYSILISSGRYVAALDFADCHKLDKDDVIKSQWLCSTRGLKEINTYLSEIKDKVFILSECVNSVGFTEESTRALLEYGLRLTNQYRFFEEEDSESTEIWDFRMDRLRLLQFRDRLETFLGVNMGRFSVHEYTKFRATPINKAAITLAESGKIGALNLLFKRHPYSLAPFTLDILNVIPETLPVQTYWQLLPGKAPPSGVVVRAEDWVECKQMVCYIRKLQSSYGIDVQIRTEPIIKQCFGFAWPTSNELTEWYKSRARTIDSSSGQLDNCLCLLDFADKKGVTDLKQFRDDVSYLHQLIYSDDADNEIALDLATWENLSDYDKFRMMLKGVQEQNVVEKLRDKAIPFMKTRCQYVTSNSQDRNDAEPFLVRWLKENASQNKLDICLRVIEEACKDTNEGGLFKDEVEAINCALQCLYLCKATDKWGSMTAILSELLQMQASKEHDGGLEKRLKLAENHIEVGRLLSFYQVPKPMDLFLESHDDGKGIKQILRLILSKFVRRQHGRSDKDWASMWRDLQSMREKAFPFLDSEYMLMEFCRGLLKAGKFSLARNYLKGTSSVALSSDKAENLVIQAAREYFFSASSLSSPEIWKAKECLNLLSSNRAVTQELDIIDALTVKLPSLGVTLLPMQFRQIKDQMEIIKMAITSQTGAYLHVDEIIEIAKLLGLSSSDEISAVQESIAREAAVAGDLQFALDLCLILCKKGHGQVWDLCAAIARGPVLENIDIKSRKQLLGFSLSHCDEESISELLHAWKDLDMRGQCEMLIPITDPNSPDFSVLGFSKPRNQEVNISELKEMLSFVAKDLPVEKGRNWESILEDNGKTYSFAAFELPQLIERSTNVSSNHRTQAFLAILSWLARNGFAPKDELIASLAKSLIEAPITEEKGVSFCSVLLNLVDAFCGVEIIEEELNKRKDYQEINCLMNVGMIYSLVHNYAVNCRSPAERRAILRRKFGEKQTPDELAKLDEVQSTFWKEWKLKLEEQKFVADRSRALQKIFPGVDTGRFLSGDMKYIESEFLSLINSVKHDKKHILKDLLNVADTYGLNRTEVLLQYLRSLLLSEVWTNDDIMHEISEFKRDIVGVDTVRIISSSIYSSIDGCNKTRLALIFGLLSDCYLELEKTEKSLPIIHHDQNNLSGFGIGRYYKVIEQECRRVSFIATLDFKHIAELGGLNLEHFNSEICHHIQDSSLETLAKMVKNLIGVYMDSVPEGLMSYKDVYKHYLLGLLETLEIKARTDSNVRSPESLRNLICQIEQSFEFCRKYIKLVEVSDAFDVIKRCIMIIVPLDECYGTLPDDSTWQDCLVILLNFWMKLTDEVKELSSSSNNIAEQEMVFNPDCLMRCINVLMRLVIEDSVSPSQGRTTLVKFVNCGLTGDPAITVFIFCRSMLFSGCGFTSVADVFSEASHNSESQDLPHLYLNLLEPILQELGLSDSWDEQNFYNILSSLSKLEGNLDDLKRVRNVIWQRLTKFSDDLKVPGSNRVYILELMQFLTGRDTKQVAAKIHRAILPWEAWDVVNCKSQQIETSGSQAMISTLIALKSTQLVGSISSSMEITPDDLANIETATSCFLKVSGSAKTESHVNSLVAVLTEWDGAFMERREEKASPVASDSGNTWNSDDWDEGWESFQDAEKTETSPSLHPLHFCWSEVFSKLASFSRFNDVLRLIDQSSDILLDENSSKTLTEAVLQIDCVAALKLALSLPYEALRTQCLEIMEDKLKQSSGFPDTIEEDLDLLILFSSSGVISSIITESSYSTTFFYISYLVGNFSRKCQTAELSGNMRGLLVFRKLIFPRFVAELVKADQQLLAGLTVTKFMHTNASLSLINIAESSLARFLERQLHQIQHRELAHDETSSPDTLKNTVSGLAAKLETAVQSALSLLSKQR